MKTKAVLLKLISLFVALSCTRAVTFEDWRALVFTPAQIADPSISGAEADPDGDHLRNFAEFALGRDPLTAESAPILTATFLPHIGTNLPRFGALFTIPLDRVNSLLLPQVTENLGTRWRADQVELWTHSSLPDGRYEYFAADAVPSDLPNHRFMRLLIAADRDLDGLPEPHMAWIPPIHTTRLPMPMAMAIPISTNSGMAPTPSMRLTIRAAMNCRALREMP